MLGEVERFLSAEESSKRRSYGIAAYHKKTALAETRNSKDPWGNCRGRCNVMTKKEINEKKYQVVDLKNGTFLVKRYNGAKAEERYTHLGYFKLIEKSVKDCLHIHDVQTRKVDGHKTIRRAKSDALTKLRNILPLLESEYVFYPLENANMSESESFFCIKCGWVGALTPTLGMARVVSPGLFAWGWGRAPPPGKVRTKMNITTLISVLPLPDVYNQASIPHLILAFRDSHTLQFYVTRGSFRGKGAEPL